MTSPHPNYPALPQEGAQSTGAHAQADHSQHAPPRPSRSPAAATLTSESVVILVIRHVEPGKQEEVAL